jgi:hypothetical protein
MVMKPGKYWIGDLCYALGDKWDEVCTITIQDNKCLSGEFHLYDGTPFAMYGTKWGDGCYPDENGRGYPVDSGTIGCISVDYLLKHHGLPFPHGGHVVEFKHEFSTGSENNGMIHFGNVSIDTGGKTDWEIDEEEEEEEE